MASTYLTRTLGTPTLATKATCSLWFKRSKPDEHGSIIFGNGNGGGIFLHNNNSMYVYNNDSSALQTNRLFRDVNAWYHVVYSIDTTQSTASNRLKLYINGVQETSFASSSYPNQNSASLLGTATEHNIGRNNSGSNFFNGIISHLHFIDGTAYDASAFGEYDANGVWKIKTSPSVTYGTNGFFILKDTNSGTDQSGNSNNFTVAGGTLTKTEDSPSNVFATMNVLTNPAQITNGNTFSNGNNTCSFSTGALVFPSVLGSIGMTSGKWYWEAKITSSGSTTGVGIYEENQSLTDDYGGTPSNYNDSDLIQFASSGGSNFQINLLENAGATNAVVSSLYSGTIIGVAFDADNRKLFFYTNGSEPSGQNIGSGTSLFNQLSAGKTWLPAFYHGDGGTGTKTGTIEVNFGNGYFSSTQISSAGTNASGNGIFEYDVPTGYTALSTKGLNL